MTAHLTTRRCDTCGTPYSRRQDHAGRFCTRRCYGLAQQGYGQPASAGLLPVVLEEPAFLRRWTEGDRAVLYQLGGDLSVAEWASTLARPRAEVAEALRWFAAERRQLEAA